jgi:hypothetical protein
VEVPSMCWPQRFDDDDELTTTLMKADPNYSYLILMGYYFITFINYLIVTIIYTH